MFSGCCLQEAWKPIAGCAGFEVSDHGRVSRNGVVMKQCRSSGYLSVNVKADSGKRSVRRIHRLVLEAFVGPCRPGMECLHGPNGISDNSITNLKCGTRRENAIDTRRDGTMFMLNSNPSAIASKYGVHPKTVTRIRNGTSRAHLRGAQCT